ncbi:MAG: hypothetical protein RMY63_40175 [Nostoc sp. ChiQUE01b]|nr:CHAT domain-containing protein [Nostoc sp. ChiQUE01b]MDZ8264547.1 hypothetical protein [Nostoc sp. ChiQUE01b]
MLPYKALKYPTPLTFHQIQQQLDKDSILLQYSLGKERSYLWVVTTNSLQSYELAKEEEIETAAKKLHTLLRAKRMSGMPIEPTIEATSKLSQLILKPVAQQLGQKRLVIVADGALQYIPFAALTDPFFWWINHCLD